MKKICTNVLISFIVLVITFVFCNLFIYEHKIVNNGKTLVVINKITNTAVRKPIKFRYDDVQNAFTVDKNIENECRKLQGEHFNLEEYLKCIKQ